MPPLNSFAKTSLALALGHALATPLSAATLTVNSLGDDVIALNGACTLREAIISVNDGVLNADCGATAPGANDSIVFAPAILATDTISLSNGSLGITNNVAITGPEKILDGHTVERLTLLQTSIGSKIFAVSNIVNSPAIVASISQLEISGGVTGDVGSGVSIEQQAELTINDCMISSNTAAFGGGVFVGYGASLSLQNSTLQSNTATVGNGGGLLALDGARASITDTFIFANYAEESGGAVSAVDNSTVTINSSNIEFNSASAQGGCIGGEESSTIILNEVFLNRCYASASGGGIAAVDSNISLSNSSISDSQARSTDGSNGGGGIRAQGNSTVNVDDSYISFNSSSRDGGAIHVDAPAVVSLNRSSIERNSATRFGGGGYATGVINVNSSTVLFNLADNGGGLLSNNGGMLNLSNSTVVANSATPGRGGGVFAYVNGEARITNSIVSQNVASSYGKEVYADLSADISSSGANIFGSTTNNSADAFQNFNVPASDINATSDGSQPSSFQDIFVSTVAAAPNGTNFIPLAETSPARDIANLSACPTRDQLGKNREDALGVPIVTRNGKVAFIDLGGACDIGAVEFADSAPVGTD